MSLFLSPLIAPLVQERDGSKVATGMFHRLTGAAFEVPPELVQILGFSTPPALDAASLAELRSGAFAHVLDLLQAEFFLVTSNELGHVLEPFLDWAIIKPVRNPCIAYRQADGSFTLIRPAELSWCDLPRACLQPDLIDEVMPEPAARVFSLADGTLTLAEALSRAGQDPSDAAAAWRTLSFLSDPERQLIRVVPPNTSRDDYSRPHHQLPRNLRWRSGRDSAAVSGAYHYASAIPDTAWNFDWTEPTVSHAFRRATPALEEQTYGARFCDRVIERSLSGCPNRRHLKVLEVGAGLGDFAAAFLERIRGRLPGIGIEYTILDRSEELVRAQRNRLRAIGDARVRFIIADVQQPFPLNTSFDLVFANEMLADLEVDESAAASTPRMIGTRDRIALAMPMQSGLRRLLENLKGGLDEGGAAYLVEYGTIDALPERAHHLNHPEYSVSFAAAQAIAESLGFTARLWSLREFLRVRDDALLLVGEQEQYCCLARFLRGAGKALEFAAMGAETFANEYGEVATLSSLAGVRFAAARHGLHFGPDIGQFWAMELKIARPSQGATVECC